jgi:hypothetical protein
MMVISMDKLTVKTTKQNVGDFAAGVYQTGDTVRHVGIFEPAL